MGKQTKEFSMYGPGAITTALGDHGIPEGRAGSAGWWGMLAHGRRLGSWKTFIFSCLWFQGWCATASFLVNLQHQSRENPSPGPFCPHFTWHPLVTSATSACIHPQDRVRWWHGHWVLQSCKHLRSSVPWSSQHTSLFHQSSWIWCVDGSEGWGTQHQRADLCQKQRFLFTLDLNAICGAQSNKLVMFWGSFKALFQTSSLIPFISDTGTLWFSSLIHIDLWVRLCSFLPHCRNIPPPPAWG